MTNTPKTWIAITAATIPIPASADGSHPAERQLIGIGLFLARYDGGRWRFKRYAHAASAGGSEGSVLEKATDQLPAEGTLIGWDVDRRLMPPLLDAAATTLPVVAQRFLERLHQLLRSGTVDIALGHGVTPLATVAAEMAIYTPTWDAEALIADWAVGEVDRLLHDLADEALAIWRVFVRSAGIAGLEAEAATDAWFARRSTLRLVERAAEANDREQQ